MVLDQVEPETCGTGAGICTAVIQNGQCIDCKFWKLSEIVCEIGRELDDQLECDHYVSV